MCILDLCTVCTVGTTKGKEKPQGNGVVHVEHYYCAFYCMCLLGKGKAKEKNTNKKSMGNIIY